MAAGTVGVFAWRKSYEVGVARIDEQHKRLVEMLNDLQSAMQAGQGQSVQAKILDELVRYAGYHFRTEESLMETSAYPDAARHVLEHQKFVQQVQRLISEAQDGRGGVTVKLLHFLRDWLFQHIQNSDRRFGEYYNSR